MSPGTKELLEKVASRPAEDQQEMAEAAAEIEARRTGRYTMTDGRGEFASDQEMHSFLHGMIIGEPPKKGGILEALRHSPLVGADLNVNRSDESPPQGMI